MNCFNNIEMTDICIGIYINLFDNVILPIFYEIIAQKFSLF